MSKKLAPIKVPKEKLRKLNSPLTPRSSRQHSLHRLSLFQDQFLPNKQLTPKISRRKSTSKRPRKGATENKKQNHRKKRSGSHSSATNISSFPNILDYAEKKLSRIKSFGNSDFSSTNPKSFQDPLKVCEQEILRYHIFESLSMKQREKIIKNIIQRLCTVQFMSAGMPKTLHKRIVKKSTDLASLFTLCLIDGNINKFHPTFCRNVLIEVIKTIPQNKLLPIGFVINKLLDDDQCTFKDLEKYIKDSIILKIWKYLIRYWKHFCKTKQDTVTDISSIFSSVITHSSLNHFDKLNYYAANEIKSQLVKELENPEIDEESSVKQENDPKIFGDYVLISTEQQRLISESHQRSQMQSIQSMKKSKKDKRSNNKVIEDQTLNQEKFSKEYNDVWNQIYLVLTTHHVFFYTKKKGKKVGSILLKNLLVSIKIDKVVEVARTGGDEDNMSNESNPKKFTNTPIKEKKGNNKTKFNEELIKQESDPRSKEDQLLLVLSEINQYNSILIKLKNKEEVKKWTSNILIRKRSLINNLPFISQKLSLKDPDNKILHSLLLSKNISLVSAIIENFDTRVLKNNFESGDLIARSLVVAFHSKGKVMRILRWMIYRETVNGKNNARTLFRSSSLSSKIIPVFVHIIGNEFLKSTLSSTIAMAARIKSHLEVDEDRVGKEVAEKNTNALTLLTNEFIGKIILSIRETPYYFRLICRAMEKSARRVFPASSYQSINNFIFLRFFVPAIATPEAFGIMEKKDIDITLRRNLVTISKIIQSVGNQSEGMSGSLSCLDSFVRQSAMRIMRYFEEMTEIPQNIDEDENKKHGLPEEQVIEALTMLRTHIKNNWEDIRDVLMHSDSRSDYSVFISDFIENLITD
ncbi:ras gtpase-activating protein [Anaeramoeba flamelloides]|uniref:Ras gtpase-activating protein n=1 Tax=Anaeramoeba flamelloides TaxID=1746091 RepID=A0ABQ8XSD7_9EUKA|nr:ras gtpase-activating protein [Anaeramoeba flamelloides]